MEKNECPTNCPFLEIRSYLPEVMPFFCKKYNTYLGMTPAKKVTSCPLCQRVNVSIQQQGVELLETFPRRVAELKKAFLQLRPMDQQNLVNLWRQYGIQFQWPMDKPITPINVLAEMKHRLLDRKKKEQSPEVQEFLKLLDVVGTEGDPMSAATKTLLSNLFQVLDASEKGMLLHVLENPARAKAFLDVFAKMPQDQNLLKNFRLLLYDMDKESQQKEKGNVLLVSERGKALNLAQHMHLQHVMQQMIQARTKKNTRS